MTHLQIIRDLIGLLLPERLPGVGAEKPEDFYVRCPSCREMTANPPPRPVPIEPWDIKHTRNCTLVMAIKEIGEWKEKRTLVEPPARPDLPPPTEEGNPT